jgi:hypothetical protein
LRRTCRNYPSEIDILEVEEENQSFSLLDCFFDASCDRLRAFDREDREEGREDRREVRQQEFPSIPQLGCGIPILKDKPGRV